MRILFVLPHMPADPDDTLDDSTCALRTAAALGRRGHEVRLLVPSRREQVRERAGVTVHEFAPGVMRPRDAGDHGEMLHALREQPDFDLLLACEYWIRFAGIVKTGFVPDVVDCDALEGIGFFLVHQRLLGRKEACAPVVTSCRAPGFLRDPANWIDSYQLPRYLAHSRELYQLVASDAILVTSQFMRSTLEERLHGESPYVCPPYVRDDDWPDAMAPAPNKTLLFWGRLGYSSGVLSLLKVCRYLWDEGLVFKVNLAGRSEFHAVKGCDMATHIGDRYRRYVSRGLLNLSTGTGGDLSLREMLKESRALIYPALFDDTPHSYLEAMAFGRPVIASQSGGQADLIEPGRSGLMFRDLGQLEEHIKTILAAGPSELEELGRCAQERVRTWCDPNSSLNGRVAWYQGLIERSACTNRTLFPRLARLDGKPTPSFSGQPAPPKLKDCGRDLISVVIPCYNLGKYLRESIDSVCRSDYRPIELIVVDDASTDELTRRVLDEIENLHLGDPELSISILRQDRNRGVEEVRNLGATVSEGEFLCFLDADDLVHPEYFSKCAAVLKQYDNVGFVGSWAREFGNSSGYRTVPNFDFPFSLLWNQAFSCSLIRRCAYRKAWVPTILEDYEQWISIAESGWAGVVIPEVLFFYRMRRNSRYSGSTSYEARIAYQLIVKAHADTYQRYGDELFLLLFQNFSYNAYDNVSPEAMPLRFWLRVPSTAIKMIVPKKIRYRLRHRFRIPAGKSFLPAFARKVLRR
ncbi:MAG: glycosyltransferase [Desulfomonilaceae bacterium]|nr:glycosyltransferase [Desulfomonilaceae bacterium]